MKRLVTGILLAILAIYVVERAPAVVFWVAIGIVALFVVHELGRILGKLGKAPWPVLASAGTLAVLAAFLLPNPPVGAALVLVLVLAFVRSFFPTQEPADGLARVAGTLLVVCYVGLTLGHLVALYVPEKTPFAADLCIVLLGCVYFGDTAALYGGKTFGRHKMAPGLSPSKTWEGAAFGLLGALGFAVLANAWFFPELPLAHALPLALVLGLVGIAGDLAESLIKRAAVVKDSGGLLPGHGGFLDRVDSLLLAAPVVYWYYRLLPPH